MMNWNADGLTDVSDSLIAADIFAVLSDAIRPLRALTVRPILFARSERFTRTPLSGNFPNALQSAPQPFFHIQYGPRAWKSAHLYLLSPFTDFGERILAMGKALEEKKLAALGGALLAMTLGRPLTPDDEHSDIAIVRQGDGWFLVLEDRGRELVVYDIGAEGLRLLGYAHRDSLCRLDQTRRRLLWPRGEDPAKEMTKEDLKADVLWRFGTKLADATRPVFLEAFEKMRAIAPEVALAYSAARFNDACGDDNWSAARVNDFAWESGSYFRNDETALAAAPPAIHTALGLLHHLLACRIAERFTATFGMEVGPVDAIGFFLQGGECYFSCSCTNGDDGPVYRVDPRTGEAQFVGVADRFDWNFNTGATHSYRATPAPACLEWTPLDAWLEQIPSREAGAARRGYGFQRLAGVDWDEYFGVRKGIMIMTGRKE